MRIVKKCIICQQEFIPNKYHPHQEVCSNKECQHKRQLSNQKEWRFKNPNYFKYKKKNTGWEKRRAHYLKIWRLTHKDYFKKYRLKNKQEVKTLVDT